MADNIKMTVSGLQCDVPGCGYNDPTIKEEEYEKYIDYPCPTCGAKLLTRADYELVKSVRDQITELNKQDLDLSNPLNKIKYSAKLKSDGSGHIAHINIKPIIEENK